MASRPNLIAAPCALIPIATAAETAPASALALHWRAAVGVDGTSSPVYADGRLFVGTATGLAGLDPSTGAIIISDRSRPGSTTPAVIRGACRRDAASGIQGPIHALQKRSPRLYWRAER